MLSFLKHQGAEKKYFSQCHDSGQLNTNEQLPVHLLKQDLAPPEETLQKHSVFVMEQWLY